MCKHMNIICGYSAGLWFPILNASVSDAGEICTKQFKTYAGAPKLFPENNNALRPTLDIQYLVAGGSILCLPTFTFATYGHIIIRTQAL